MKKDEGLCFRTPEVEGVERATALFIIVTPTGNIAYRCFSWAKFRDHWLLETMHNDQIEVYSAAYIVHVPKAGWTFELDGTARELLKESPLVVVN